MYVFYYYYYWEEEPSRETPRRASFFFELVLFLSQLSYYYYRIPKRSRRFLMGVLEFEVLVGFFCRLVCWSFGRTLWRYGQRLIEVITRRGD